MTDTLRYGIIGTGMMGCEHILSLRLVEGAEVTAVADPSPTSREWGKSAAGSAVAVYEDYRELLREAPVDVVVVATPNFTHRNVLEDVFRTHKHVLIEKPLCTRVEDCRPIVEAADRHPALVRVGMQYRYMRPVARLIEEVRRDSLGRLWMVAIREHRFPFLPKVGDWNRFAKNTGGTLVEKCCHFFDLMNLLVGRDPERVYASGAQNLNHLEESYDGRIPDIIDNAFALVDYADGARAMLDLCMFAENSPHEIVLTATGERGKAEAYLPDHRLVIAHRDGRPHQTLDFDLDEAIRWSGAHHGATYFEHCALRDAIRAGERDGESIREGARAVVVGAAAEESARTHRPVEVGTLGL